VAEENLGATMASCRAADGPGRIWKGDAWRSPTGGASASSLALQHLVAHVI